VGQNEKEGGVGKVGEQPMVAGYVVALRKLVQVLAGLDTPRVTELETGTDMYCIYTSVLVLLFAFPFWGRFLSCNHGVVECWSARGWIFRTGYLEISDGFGMLVGILMFSLMIFEGKKHPEV
jgi:hypothetical protein